MRETQTVQMLNILNKLMNKNLFLLIRQIKFANILPSISINKITYRKQAT